MNVADMIELEGTPVRKCDWYDKVTTQCDHIEMDCCWSFCPYDYLSECPIHNGEK
jgi:hypothetical protein